MIFRAHVIAAIFLLTSLYVVASEKNKPIKLDVGDVFNSAVLTRARFGASFLLYHGQERIGDGAYKFVKPKRQKSSTYRRVTFVAVQKKCSVICCGVKLATCNNRIVIKKVAPTEQVPFEDKNRVRAAGHDIVWDKSELQLTQAGRILLYGPLAVAGIWAAGGVQMLQNYIS